MHADEQEPTWDEAATAFESGTPVPLVRPARKIIIRYRGDGGQVTATSSQLTGFQIAGSNLEETRELVRRKLRTWLDPDVEVEEIT